MSCCPSVLGPGSCLSLGQVLACLQYSSKYEIQYNLQLSSAVVPTAPPFPQFSRTGRVAGRGRPEDLSPGRPPARPALRPGGPGGEQAGPGRLVALQAAGRAAVQEALLLSLEVVPVPPTAAVLEGGAGGRGEVSSLSTIQHRSQTSY